jgi:Ca-activated chloride channel family protein
MMRATRWLVFAAALAGVVPAAAAQGWIETVRPLPGPDPGVEKLRGAVRVTVQGRVASVVVEEWFRNTGAGMAEGTYHYPLPGEAVFSSFSLWQGEQELRGETMDAGRARGIYEEIVRRRKDPALIELAQHGLLRARVFPINPGETRKITLRYTQVLDRAGDAWRFRYVATPGDRVPRSFRLEAEGAERFGDPYSPTHRVTARRDDGRLAVTLADSAWTSGLELLLPLARGLVGLSLVTHQPAGEDPYFMLLVAPGTARTTTFRRDVVAVVDVSGSMAGEKIDQAKAAVAQLLGTLREGDRFRLVAFSGGVRRFAPGWTPLTPASRREAADWVHGLEADGGTNIAGAMTEALAAEPAEGHLGVIVFLTDGQPTVGQTDPERIGDAVEQGRSAFRVFTFGVGHDVNTYLIDRLAVRARGASAYIQPGGDIEQTVSALAAKIAAPVLSDVGLAAGDGVEVYDLEPGTMPDLFAGDEQVILGRVRARGRDSLSLTVTGRRAGRAERFATAADLGGSADREYVAQLWASRRAGTLAREIRLRGPNPELVQALRDLALRHGILTEYTAYLVQEPDVVAIRGRDRRLGDTGPVSLEAVTVTAPQAQTGAKAVEQAAREAQAASANVVVDGEQLNDVVRARSGIAPTRRVNNRLFVLRDSVWTDLRHADSLRVVAVEPYSPAYFELLRALPELRGVAALERVVVAGARLSLKIEAGGTREWSEGELRGIVRGFRG